MSHPESDNVGELLEGAHRSVLTAVHRWLELFERKRAMRSAVTERIAERTAAHDRAHGVVVEAVHPGDMGDPATAVSRQTVEEWERAQLLEAMITDHGPGAPWEVEAAVDVQEAILRQWTADRDRQRAHAEAGAGFDEAYWRAWAVMEATAVQFEEAEARAGAALAGDPAERDPARYRERLIGELGDAVSRDAHARYSAAATGRDHAPSTTRERSGERAWNADPATQQLDSDVADSEARLRHDTHEARLARAEQLAAQGYDRDVAEAALINDLTFATPASESLAASRRAARSPAKGRSVNRGQARQRNSVGR